VPPRRCPHGSWYCPWSIRERPCPAPREPALGPQGQQLISQRDQGKDGDDDADDDTTLPIITIGTASQTDLSFGHTGDRYWMHYRNHVFLGKRTKHMQGVQMAIADLFDLPVMPLVERDFKESTHPLPLAAPTHSIVVSTVLSNLADPFHLRQSATGEYVLLYNDREIMHPIKAVLAGYVVGVRTLMGSRA
jgi:hypothetical protein